MASFEQELRTAYKTGKVLLGTKTTIKHLKLGKAKMVVIAVNAEPAAKKDIEYYAKLSRIPIYKYNGTSVELGMLLGKPFPVQALAVIDTGDSNIMEHVEE